MAKSAARKAARKPGTFVIMGPELNMTPAQIANLKKKFKNELVTTLGGKDAMSRDDINLNIIVQTECLEL
jgi:hypothetical protein